MRKKIYFIYSLFLVVLIPIFFMFLMNSGCGSAGGGSAYFETVEISANCKATSLASDIAVWGRSDDHGICDECVILPDIVDVTIRSQSFANITMQPSEVRIEKVRIDYIPMDSDTPSLASQKLALGQFVKPDSEHTLPIEIINTDQKEKETFPLYMVRNGEIHEDKTYTYSVKLTFSGIETATDKQQNFSTDLGLRVHDFTTLEDSDFEEKEPPCDPFNITIFPLTTTLDSDVALDTDPNDGICDSLVPGEDDSVDFIIETQSYWDTGFVIEKVTIDYTCDDDHTPNDVDSRELTSIEKPINNRSLPPNGSVIVSRIIISSDQKNDPNSPLSTLKKGEKNYPETYKYDVDLTFSIRRVASDKLYDISSAKLEVEVSDIPDNECSW